MKNRVFVPKAAPEISINGHVFALKLSEVDTAQRVLDVKEFCTAILKKDNISAGDLIAIGKNIEGAINDICGENAMKTMVDGAVVRIREALDLLAIVEEEASNAYTQELLAKHE